MPVHAGEAHPVEHRLRGFHRHVGLCLDVLAVGGVLLAPAGVQHGGRSLFSLGKAQPRLAGHGRRIGIDAELTPDVEPVHRILDPGPQAGRRTSRRRERVDRQPAVGARRRGIPREDKVGKRPHRAEHRPRRPVFEREGHQIAAVPAETAFEVGVAEHQHRIPLHEGVGTGAVGRNGRRGRGSGCSGRGNGQQGGRHGGAENHRTSGHKAYHRCPAIPAGWSRSLLGRLKFWLLSSAPGREAPRSIASCNSVRWS